MGKIGLCRCIKPNGFATISIFGWKCMGRNGKLEEKLIKETAILPGGDIFYENSYKQ